MRDFLVDSYTTMASKRLHADADSEWNGMMEHMRAIEKEGHRENRHPIL